MENVIIIANSRYPKGTANSVNVFRMASAFVSKGFKVRLIALRSSLMSGERLWKETCRRYGESPEIRGSFFWWPLQRGGEPVLALISLFILPFLNRGTLVFTRISYVALLAERLGFRVIYESHAPPKNGPRQKIEKHLLLRDRSHVTLISKGLLRVYESIGLPLEGVSIAPDAGRLIRKSGPTEEEFQGLCRNIGYIGSLYPGRGFGMIVSLAEKMPEHSFHVIGDLKTSSISIEKLPGNIRLYGAVSPDEAERAGSRFDAFLMPYQQEVKIGNGLDTSQWMSPMKMFEYMLAGRPIISSNLTVIREVLHDQVNALLVGADDLGAWESALQQLDSPELRYKLARNAFYDASTNYTWDIRVERLLGSLNSGKD
jgi:glycosyltransferase involved in cell wall biosynthesis